MAKKELKRLDIKSVAFVSAALGAISGLIGGLIYGVTVLTAGLPIGGFTSEAMAITAIVGGFIGGGISGLIGGGILAFLYNLIAEKIGGIKIELD